MARKKFPRKAGNGRRCLIIERHPWETGGRQQQLQFVLDVAENFFGQGRKSREVLARVFLPPNSPQPAYEKPITISHVYPNQTRRTNKFPEMGFIPASFVFFEETGEPNVYDVWWQPDVAIVAAKFKDWTKGHNTQYGRGRLSIIVPAPVPRPITEL